MKKNLPRKIPAKQKNEIKTIANELSKLKGVDMIVLFGSFARGNFVIEDITEENKTTRCYKSDYDILIIQKYYKKDSLFKISGEIRNIIEKYGIDRSVNEVLQGINHINRMLEEKRYFYHDIIKEGILLFDSGKIQLSKPRNLSPEEKLKIQNEDFEEWFKNGNGFFRAYQLIFNEKYLNIAVFQLHQSVERYVTALLLVKTGYRPKTHDMEDFINFMGDVDDRFKNWFNLKDEEEKRKFELLRKAYVEARYSYDYKITEEELKFLEEKAIMLKKLIEKVCIEAIKQTEELAKQ